jgi:putative membrane protein insertion efficiency factor
MSDQKPHNKSRNWQGKWRKTPDRLLGIGLVRLYQLTLSGFIGNSCRHLPTCSEYAYESIGRYGLWTGGWMGLIRVIKCGPFGTHGHDPVPEELSKRYRWWFPWRK